MRGLTDRSYSIYNAITAVGLLITYFPHAHVRAEGMSKAAILKRIDFIGGFLSIVGLCLFLVALQAGGYTHPWTSAYVLCTLLIGLSLIIIWIVYEWKFAKYPMVPKELFMGQRVVALSFAVAFVAGMNFFSLLNFWPLTISTVWPYDPIKIGLRGISAGFATAIGAIFWNALLSTFPGDCKWILFIAGGMLTAFGGALSVMTPDNVVTTIALATVACFGLGGVIVPAATVAMIAAPDALITTCAALSLSVRAVGGSIGYSIYYSIFHEKILKYAPLLVGTYAVEAGLPVKDAELFVYTWFENATYIAEAPGASEKVIAAASLGLQWAYAESLHYVWYAFRVLGKIPLKLTPLQVYQHRLWSASHARFHLLAEHEQVPNQQNRSRALLRLFEILLCHQKPYNLSIQSTDTTVICKAFAWNCLPSKSTLFPLILLTLQSWPCPRRCSSSP